MKVRRLLKRFGKGEKGFTLIELLIVVAILGILAAVIIPNAAGFFITGTLNAANTEVANVKTAAVGYFAEYEGWPTHTGAANFDDFYAGALSATYSFDDDGMIDAVDNPGSTDPDGTFVSSGWNGVTFNPALTEQKWARTP